MGNRQDHYGAIISLHFSVTLAPQILRYNSRMTAEEAPRKIPRLLFEVGLVVALLGLGLYSLSVAQQQRPYLGDPLPRGSEALVPYRVLAAPNVPAIGLYLGSVFAVVMGVAWLILRGIHQLFFKPVHTGRIWREAVFFAVFVLSLAWLQLNQAFSLLLAAVIAVALILLEIFLNIRVRDE
ncbi:hypothetical protein TFLX_02875 [Thermoflexales bacterium]|nr:hypothetical protein TFLX_02875 [Thermoflexales bacterium]